MQTSLRALLQAITALVIALLVPTAAHAHSVAQVQTTIYLAPDTVQMLIDTSSPVTGLRYTRTGDR